MRSSAAWLEGSDHLSHQIQLSPSIQKILHPLQSTPISSALPVTHNMLQAPGVTGGVSDALSHLKSRRYSGLCHSRLWVMILGTKPHPMLQRKAENIGTNPMLVLFERRHCPFPEVLQGSWS